MVAVGAHHEEAGPRVTHVLEQDLGRGCRRRNGVQPVRRAVGGEVLAGLAGDGFGLGAVAVDAHDLDVLARPQAEQLERLQGSRGLSPASVRHDHPVPVGKLASFSAPNSSGLAMKVPMPPRVPGRPAVTELESRPSALPVTVMRPRSV